MGANAAFWTHLGGVKGFETPCHFCPFASESLPRFLFRFFFLRHGAAAPQPFPAMFQNRPERGTCSFNRPAGGSQSTAVKCTTLSLLTPHVNMVVVSSSEKGCTSLIFRTGSVWINPRKMHIVVDGESKRAMAHNAIE